MSTLASVGALVGSDVAEVCCVDEVVAKLEVESEFTVDDEVALASPVLDACVEVVAGAVVEVTGAEEPSELGVLELDARVAVSPVLGPGTTPVVPSLEQDRARSRTGQNGLDEVSPEHCKTQPESLSQIVTISCRFNQNPNFPCGVIPFAGSFLDPRGTCFTTRLP